MPLNISPPFRGLKFQSDADFDNSPKRYPPCHADT